MSSRRSQSRRGKENRVEDTKWVHDLFSGIAPDVIELMIESCNGRVADAVEYLRGMEQDMLQVSSMATPDEADPNDPQSFSQQMPDQEDVTSSVNGVPEEEQGINERFGLEMISLPQTHLDPQDLPDDYSPSLPVYVSVDIVDTVVPPPSAYVPFWAREVSASADLPLLPINSVSSESSDSCSGGLEPFSGLSLSETLDPVTDLPLRNNGLDVTLLTTNIQSLDMDGISAEYFEPHHATTDLPIADNSVDRHMVLTLDKELAIKLIMTFGLMQVPINTNDDANLTVSLDMRTAYKLFQAWKETQESAASAALASFPAAPGGEDERLARALQDMEHETYAVHQLKSLGMNEIMDETLALRLAEKESEIRGLDVGNALQYQSVDGVESKWVDVLLKSHNFHSDADFPAFDAKPRNIYASPVRTASGVYAAETAEKTELYDVVKPVRNGQKILRVTPVSSAPAICNLTFKQKDDPVDYFGLRQEALQLQRKAIDYGEKAGKAFTNKKLGGGAAAYYLQKSHEHKSMAKEAHLEASQHILASRNINASDGEIDLHGLRADEVNATLDVFFARKHKQKEIKIISGRGAHSRTGKSEVRTAVEVYLRKYQYQFEEGPPAGVFYVDKWQKLHARPP